MKALHRSWRRYLAAILLVALAAAMRIWPLQTLGSKLTWLTFYPAVILAALYGGPWAGVLATAASCLVVTLLWPLFAASPFITGNGDWLGLGAFVLTGSLIAAISRVTNRAQARAKVFQTLVMSMDDGFCVIEMIYDRVGKPVDYRFVEVNAAFEAQTGLRQAQGKTMREMVPNHEDHWFEVYGRVARTGQEVRFENPAVAMERYYDVFAFRIGEDGSRRVGILFKDISKRKKSEQDLILSARYDKLTGLPNRTMFYDHLARALPRAERGGQSLALLFLDLDGFKAVNDTHGHQAGDKLLQRVAERLSGCVRAGDLVSRLGGDEFTIIMENCQAEHLAGIAAKIVLALEQTIDIDDHPVQISASIGVVTYPECATDVETLVRLADTAMYEAKKEAGLRYRIWPPRETEHAE
jgi:diguanylate cyclase (GGDEF)-like protein/PAS domain S-box-containing protein